jgi:GT2 family glycosyltransferase
MAADAGRQSPAVTAIVVTHDSAQHVEDCLAALLAQTVPVEVVVVDNGSSDRSVERAMAVQAVHPDRVRVVPLATNTGFTSAVNHAIAMSDADAVLLCNPDARLAEDYVAHLQAALAADASLGSVQGTLWRPRRAGLPPRVDSTGHRAFVTRLFGNRDEGRTMPGPGGDVFGVTGAAALHRRSMLDDVAVPPEVLAGRTQAGWRRTVKPASRAERAGGHGRPEWLDETLFAYYDDIDLDWRARLRGWRAAHVPAAVGVHERGGAGARRSPLVEECNAANRLLVLAKLDHRPSLVRFLPAVVAGTVLKLLWLALTQPLVVPRVVRRVVRGWRPTMRRRRHALATATVDPATVVAAFESFDWRSWVRRWWLRVRSPAVG